MQSSDTAATSIQPYTELGRGIRVGFEDGASIAIGKPSDETGVYIDIVSLGTTRWLTLEFSVDLDLARDCRIAFFSLSARSIPRIRYRIDFRLWAEDGTFTDNVIGYGGLRESMTRRSEFVHLDDFGALSGSTAASYILVLPLIEARYVLEQVALIPVRPLLTEDDSA
jgi:hypothetical protein